MVDLNQTLTPIGSFFGLTVAVGTVIVAIFYGRAKARTANADGIANAKDMAMADMQKSLVLVRDQNTDQAAEILKLRNDQANEMLKLNSKVTELSGTVNTLKNIPLGKIQKHMEDSTRHMENTNRLIELLIPLIPTTVSVDTTTKTITTNEK
jgi:hypothetical protein